MEEYKISIIVPVYNKEKYLRKSIDSLVNQTYLNKEILLVDDGSTDKSGVICDEYAQRYDFVRVLHKENGGPSSAWKAGFGECSGEYIAFIDSDDWVDTDMLEEMSKELTGSSAEMILCDHVLESSKGQTYVYQELPPGEYHKADIEYLIIPNLLGREHRYISLSRCMKLISRKLIDDNKDFCDTSILIGDDSTITIPCILDADRIVNMNRRAFYHYLYVEDSVVHRYDEHMPENNELLIENYFSTFSKKLKDRISLLSSVSAAIDREHIYLLLLAIKNEARGNKASYMKNIKTICNRRDFKALVKKTKVSINDTSNRLLYAVLKHPNSLTIMILRLAMVWYYRK